MSAYEIVIIAHSLLRWVVLGMLLWVVARAVRGWRSGAPWTAVDERLHRGLVSSADLQFLLGLLLYCFLSPICSAFFADPRNAMRETTLRFFGVEHVLMMSLGLTALHVGRVRSKRASTPELRHRRVFTWTFSALALILVGIPWPFLRYGRPLLRLFS